MIVAIRAYQPVSIPGRVSMNMISKKQVPELTGIIKVPNGFMIQGTWISKWEGENVTFDVFIPDSNVQFSYMLPDYELNSSDDLCTETKTMPENQKDEEKQYVKPNKPVGEYTFYELKAYCVANRLGFPHPMSRKALMERVASDLNPPDEF